MEQQLSAEGITSLAEVPVMVEQSRVFETLGYSRVENKVVANRFNTTWREKAKDYSLGELPELPNITAIEKEGRIYLAIEFSAKLSLVVDSAFTNVNPNGIQLLGNPIEHILVTDKGLTLDLMTVLKGSKEYKAILSFFGHGSYSPNERQGNPYILAPIHETKGAWKVDDFVNMFLHEHTHHQLSNRHYGHIGWELTNPQKEREVNALTLRLIRQIVQKYPYADLVNQESFARWAEKQLSGYDKPENVGAGLDYMASYLERKLVRIKDLNATNE